MSIRSMFAAVLALAALALASAPAAAQERQVALDEQGRVQVVDARMAQRLGLWVEEHPGFQEARLFRTPAGEYVLEITTETRGETARRRLPLSEAEVAELRRRVSEGVARAPVLLPGGQEGRYLLLAQTTLAGVSYYGAALPRAVGAEGSGFAALYLATAAGSFFLPWALTHDVPVTYGMANLSRYGVTRGFAHGWLLHDVIRGEEPTERHCEPEWGFCYDIRTDDYDRTRAAASFLVGAAEGVGGYLWARNEEMSPGTANAIVTYGDAGTLWGLGAGHLLDAGRRGSAALGLAGAAGGILGGRAIAARRSYTWGDTDVIYTAGVLGGYTGMALTLGVLGVDDTDDRAVTAMAMAGSAAGLFLGDHLVRETNFTVAQATLNRLGTLAGGLAGATLGVAMEDVTVTLLGSAAGAAVGYFATYGRLAPEARENVGDRITRWNVEVNPAGAAALTRGRAGESGAATPLLSVRYRF